MPRRHRFQQLAIIIAGLALVLGAHAEAAPALRKQVDQRGNFLLIGNTLGYDCVAATPAPVVGTVGACGANTSDTASDVFWRADSPAMGQAQADTTITSANARSTAVLAIPSGATITYARLYWAAKNASAAAGTSVTFERPGGISNVLTADSSFVSGTFYESTADVTPFVQAQGPGAYRAGNIASLNLVDLNDSTSFVAWSMVVFYQLASDPPRNLALFDGADVVTNGNPQSGTINGFLVPNAGFDAKLGVIAYEGDDSISGDAFNFNGTALTNALNPANNFFNATRSNLGAAVSVAGDLPQLTGGAASMSGIDLDVVDITARVAGGQTSATVQGTSTGDIYVLGVFVTGISTLKPLFTNTTKTVTNLTRAGSVLPGDTLEYTITTSNTGTDTGQNVVLTDVLPAGITFVNGSLRITTGANTGTKTDAADSDQGEYTLGTRTLRVRLGTNADGTTGGTITTSDPTQTVKFQVTVDATTTGTVNNQATVTAAGVVGATQGIGPVSFPSSNGGGAFTSTTPFVVDKCASNADCPSATPRCNTAVSPHLCTACATNADCGGATPTCDTVGGTCVRCVANTDCPSGATCSAANACALAAPVVVTPANGSTINTPMPTLSGTAPANSTVTVRVDGAVIGTTTADAAGSWSIVAPSSLAPGSHAVSATATVGSGALAVTSPSSNTNTFNVITGCLANSDCGGATPICKTSSNTCVRCIANTDCPSGATCNGGNQCILPAPVAVTPANGSTINQSQPTLAGTAPANTTVNVFVDGVFVGTTLASATGNWSLGTPMTLAPGAHTLSATATSGTGVTAVTSSASNTNTFTVVNGCLANADCSGATPICKTSNNTCVRCIANTDCPAAATCNAANQCILAPPVVTTPANGSTTNKPKPQIRGTAPPNTTVNVSIDGVLVGTATADGTGAWTFTPLANLTPGSHTVNATDTVGSGVTAVTSGTSNTNTFTYVNGCLANSDCTTSTAAFCNLTNNTCVGCTGDNGGGTTFACPLAATPYCAASGTCGKCASNTDCSGHPAGPTCNTTSGACGNICFVDSDCASTQWCSTGACTPKTPNGQPLPAQAPIAGSCTQANGTRVCLSGACDPSNKTCGLTNSKSCGPPTKNSVCQSNICYPTDNECGEPNTIACTTAALCRSGICFADSKCGEPNGETCSSTAACRNDCVAADLLCGLLNGSPCSAATACRSNVCNSDGRCGDPNGISCSFALTCRSQICAAGVCGTSCATDGDCAAVDHCDTGRCVDDLANSAACTRVAECSSGVCNADGKCGDPNDTSCAGATTCRSATCSAGVCGAACSLDAECATDRYCKASTCAPRDANGVACTAPSHCSAGVCNVDGKCGVPDGQPCSLATLCRGGVCDANGTCGSASCTADAQCTAGRYCDLSSKTCLPELVNGTDCIRSAQCVSDVCEADGKCGEPNGGPCGSLLLCRSSICTTAGVCGDCLSDSDCGALTSGKVCDGTNTCVDGCRGTGGNTCDVSLVCSSTTNAIGTCAPPPDFGSDGATAPPDLGTVDASEAPDLSTVDGPYGFAGGGFGCTLARSPASPTDFFTMLLLLAFFLCRRSGARAGR